MLPRIVDLSQPITPADRRGTCRMEPWKTIAQHGADLTLVTFDTHLGTHLDAPSHQVPGGPTLEQVDLARCIGPAEVLDFHTKRPHEMIDAADLQTYADRILPGGRLLLRTDWSRLFGQPEYTLGYPALTVAAAEYLVERGVVMVGIDSLSIAPVYQGMAITNAVHIPLLQAGVVIVESLANLAQLRQPTVQFIGLPLLMPGIDGSPIRAVAIE